MKDWNLQIVERVMGLLGKRTSTEGPREAEPVSPQTTGPEGSKVAEPEGAKATETDGGPSAALYNCQKCETMYISEEMQSCPECGSTVDQRPSAAELGIRSSTR